MNDLDQRTIVRLGGISSKTPASGYENGRIQNGGSSSRAVSMSEVTVKAQPTCTSDRAEGIARSPMNMTAIKHH